MIESVFGPPALRRLPLRLCDGDGDHVREEPAPVPPSRHPRGDIVLVRIQLSAGDGESGGFYFLSDFCEPHEIFFVDDSGDFLVHIQDQLRFIDGEPSIDCAEGDLFSFHRGLATVSESPLVGVSSCGRFKFDALGLRSILDPVGPIFKPLLLPAVGLTSNLDIFRRPLLLPAVGLTSILDPVGHKQPLLLPAVGLTVTVKSRFDPLGLPKILLPAPDEGLTSILESVGVFFHCYLLFPPWPFSPLPLYFAFAATACALHFIVAYA